MMMIWINLVEKKEMAAKLLVEEEENQFVRLMLNAGKWYNKL